MTTGAGKGLIGSLQHGLQILDMFERERPEIGIGEMAEQLGLHRSTTSRLAATLAAAGYLQPAGEPGRYRLSGRLAALGELAAAGADVRRTALPYLRSLVQELGETGHLGVLEGTEAVTVGVVDGWQTVRMHSWVGKRSPAHCSSMGKALLAGLSAAEFAARYPRRRLEARTDRTITDTRELTGHLIEVRNRGYAPWTARSSSPTCAAWPGRCSTGPGSSWRASASPAPIPGSMTARSRPSRPRYAAPPARSAPGSAPPVPYRSGVRRQPGSWPARKCERRGGHGEEPLLGTLNAPLKKAALVCGAGFGQARPMGACGLVVAAR